MHKNIIQDNQDYLSIKKATEISVNILRELVANVKIGVDASDIDNLAKELCEKNKVKAAFFGVEGEKINYPSYVCISVNDEILHSIPHKGKVFKDGDLVKVDFGIIYDGYYTDHCTTIALGQITELEKKLLNTGRLCIDTAIKSGVVGGTVGDISYALQSVTEMNDFNFVKNYCGHGIGKSLWIPPEILSFGQKGTGEKLVDGMVLCIENQIVTGDPALQLNQDGWSLSTKDGSKGVMFEHMIIVRKNKPEILTLLS